MRKNYVRMRKKRSRNVMKSWWILRKKKKFTHISIFLEHLSTENGSNIYKTFISIELIYVKKNKYLLAGLHSQEQGVLYVLRPPRMSPSRKFLYPRPGLAQVYIARLLLYSIPCPILYCTVSHIHEYIWILLIRCRKCPSHRYGNITWHL